MEAVEGEDADWSWGGMILWSRVRTVLSSFRSAVELIQLISNVLLIHRVGDYSFIFGDFPESFPD